MLGRESRPSRHVQSGCAVIKEHCKSPGGNRTTATMANRVKSSSGSFNARWRRESPCGNTEEPEADYLRESTQTVDHEKLNDERGFKPLPVNGSRDGAGSGKAWSGGVREQLLYSSPRNQFQRIGTGNYAGVGTSHIPGKPGRTSPTNVTAVVESMTNRARGVAAGVVSGAGDQSAGA